MESADKAFEPARPTKRGSAGNWWWLLMLHATWSILLVIGAWYGYTSWRFASQGEKVSAHVIALEEHYSTDSGTTYSPVFEYKIGDQTYTYESVNSSDPPTHQVGDAAVLLVDPARPGSAREDSFWELWLLPVIMCPIALVVAVVAFALTIVVKPWGGSEE